MRLRYAGLVSWSSYSDSLEAESELSSARQPRLRRSVGRRRRLPMGRCRRYRHPAPDPPDRHQGIRSAWSMAFLPDGGVLVTDGRAVFASFVRRARSECCLGYATGAGAKSPGPHGYRAPSGFNENKLVYFTYHKPAGADATPGNNAGVITLARGRWDGKGLVEVNDIFSAIQNGNASRIVFGRDGMVYMSVGTGDPPAAARAQDPNDLAGKVLRLRDDGTVPPDNPFVGRQDIGRRSTRWVIECVGIRRPAGYRRDLGVRSWSERWRRNQRPSTGEELWMAGGQFWPVLSRPRVTEKAWKENMEPPLVFWVPAITESGMAFYTGDKFPAGRKRLRRRPAKAKSREPDTSIGSTSTRSGKNSTGNRFSATCNSGFATFGKARMAIYIC